VRSPRAARWPLHRAARLLRSPQAGLPPGRREVRDVAQERRSPDRDRRHPREEERAQGVTSMAENGARDLGELIRYLTVNLVDQPAAVVGSAAEEPGPDRNE